MLDNELEPRICQLFIYPIKSCAGISVSEMSFDEKGPLLDRRWMLVDEKTQCFLSQRELHQMCLISTSIVEGGKDKEKEVWASQKINPTLNARIKLPSFSNNKIDEQALINVTVWDDHVQGFDCGDEVAYWFSSLLNHQCRLVFQGGCDRMADEKYADKNTAISFSDGFPLLVINKHSVDFLNEHCENSFISSLNFRPNIVVENTEKFSENNWAKLTTQWLDMKVVKPCQRCVIPTLNPKTSEPEREILNALIKHCRKDDGIYFGQNLTFKKLNDNAVLSVKDAVLVENTASTQMNT